MEYHIGTEKIVHGQHWSTLHGGYFSDPAIARPLVETTKGILAKSPADVVVDLGGGTGFLLNQLASHRIGANVALVNVDCSEAQLDLIDKNSISSVCTSIGGGQTQCHRGRTKTVLLPDAVSSSLPRRKRRDALTESPSRPGQRRRVFLASERIV